MISLCSTNSRIPIFQLEQQCSTEATIGSNLFLYPESLAYLCIPFAVLLSIDPSQNSPSLQHSMLSSSELTLQISKCCSRSASPNLERQASLGQIRIHKACSLARPLAKCIAASAKSNLSWANGSTSCCVNLIKNQTPSSVYSNQCCVL